MASRILAFDEDPHPTGELPAASRPAALSAGADAVLAQVNSYIENRPAEEARILREWADERSKESV
jgi:hypothetical protein